MSYQPSVRHNGKEWVTIAEFAKRVNCCRDTVKNYINKGILKPKDVKKDGHKYLQWESQRLIFEEARAINNATTPKAKRRENSSPIISPKLQLLPSVDQVKVDELNNDLQELSISDNAIDLSKINPYDHKDCWLLDAEGQPIRDADGNPKLNYDMLKTKVTVETYQVKLDQMKGNLVPKDELVISIEGIFRILKTNIDAIPNRYASQIVAMSESITGHEFTPQEHTQIMNVMRSVPKDFFGAIEVEIQKLKDKNPLSIFSKEELETELKSRK